MKTKRLYYIDVLNCVAIIFVLFLHSTQLAHTGNTNLSHYRLALVIQSICYPAVYIFLMNSGATLLDYRKKYSTTIFFKKRVYRVLIPFLAWSFIYYFYSISHIAYPGTTIQSHPSFINFIKAFVNNDINALFWFFYTILALYLIVPIVSPLVEKHLNTLFYIVVMFFLCSNGLQFISNFTGINFRTSFISQPLISSSYLGFFIVGYLIKVNYFNNRQQIILIIIGMTSLTLNLVNDLFYGKNQLFNNMDPFLYSVGIYLLIKKIVAKLSNDKIKIFTTLSGASLGIYVLHPFIYELMDKYIYGTTADNWQSFLRLMNDPIYMFSLPIVTYFILTPTILLLKRIKLTRVFIP